MMELLWSPLRFVINRSLQITGDLAILTVVGANDDGDAIGPEYPPKWTAVRVVRLR